MSDRLTEPDYLKNQQYSNSDKLAARIRLHREFTVPNVDIWEWFFDIVLQEAPASATVLEAGTGRGDVWKRNEGRIPAGWQITLTDFSEGMIEDNKAYLGDLAQRMTYHPMDVQHIPYDDDSFDVIFANFMLYHVPDLPRAIAELRRVLRDGGVLFAATNGVNHMIEMRKLIASVDETIDTKTVFHRSFSLQEGDQPLKEHFAEVTMHPFRNAIVVDSVQPVLDYVASMITIPAERFSGEKEQRLRAELERRIAADSAIRIEKESGVFVAR